MDSISYDALLEIKKNILKTKSADPDIQISTLLNTFPTIFNSVKSSNVNTLYRTVSCDTLSIWLQRCIQLFNKNIDIKSQFIGLLNDENATFIFHYVIDFWNDSGAALGNALKELFIKMLNYLTFLLPAENKNDLCQKWLTESLKIPYTMRAFYFMIEHLHKQVKPNNFILVQKPHFVKDCLNNIWSRVLGSVVGKSIFLVLRYNYNKDDEATWLSLWSNEVIKCLDDINLRKGIENYLLPNLFQVSKSATIKFLRKIIHQNSDIPILLSVLKVAQDTSIVIEPFLEIDIETNKPLIDIDEICSLLKLKTASYRIGAFQLLVSSPKLSKAISSIIYQQVSNSLDMIFMDSDLETRNELYSYFKRFIYRIKDSTYALNRDANSLTKKNFSKFESEIKDKLNSINESKNFFNNLLNHIQDNLRPDSSYLRKEMSYKMLLALVRSGLDSRVSNKFTEKCKTSGFPYSIDIYNSSLTRMVVDNITDNFDDIRHYSTEIITMSPLLLEEVIDMELLESRALEMLGDIKGKEVDSGARFFKFTFNYYQNKNNLEKCTIIMTELVNKIDFSIEMAKQDLSKSCISYSIQGYFAAFKFIFEIINFNQFKTILIKEKIVDKLIGQYFEIWNIVQHVLQHDSPEGLLLDEFQKTYTFEQEKIYGKATQVISSYAWRSIKESSNMMDVLFTAKKQCPISNDQLLNVGDLLIEQLATIRHRGAFSSVFPTFVSCCTLCTNREETSNQPQIWLKTNLNLIQSRSKYITRRSAGIPFLITAILSSNKKLVESTFETLIKIAKVPVEVSNADMDDVNLPQVNAFNCIKAIFIDASLGEESMLHVNEAFELSLSCFGSLNWSIRNCAVMLFTALQNRLFSCKKVKANHLPSYPARLFFEKFTSIHELFFNTLKSSVSTGLENQNEIEKVFPILTILSRLEPTPGYTGLNDFMPLIIKILGNKTWKLREMSARSLPSMISDSVMFDSIINQMIDNINESDKDYNKIHGSLLAIKEVILSFIGLSTEQSMDTVEKLKMTNNLLRKKLLFKLDIILNKIDCYPIKLTYFQILKLICIDGDDLDLDIIDCLSNWFIKENHTGSQLDGSKQLALKQLLEILHDSVNDKQLIELCLSSSLYEVQLSCISFYQNKLNNSGIDDICKDFLKCNIWSMLKNERVWNHVKSKGLKLLKDIIIESNDSFYIIEIENDTSKLFDLLEFEFNEDIKLSAIEALGSYISKLMITDGNKFNNIFDKWTNIIDEMKIDEAESIVRHSALKSLIAFDEIFSSNTIPDEKIKLVVEGYIFEFLTDDDEKASEIAASHLTRYVLKKDLDLISVEVEKSVLEYFESIQDKKLLECFITSNGFNFYDKTKLEDILSSDLLLFSAEKSNLERNPTDKMKELIGLIDNTKLKECKEALNGLVILLVRNLKDIEEYLENEKIIDGCFGLLSNGKYFDFVYCQLLLFKCLERNNVIDFKIGKLENILKSKDFQCHPLIYELL